MSAQLSKATIQAAISGLMIHRDEVLGQIMELTHALGKVVKGASAAKSNGRGRPPGIPMSEATKRKMRAAHAKRKAAVKRASKKAIKMGAKPKVEKHA